MGTSKSTILNVIAYPNCFGFQFFVILRAVMLILSGAINRKWASSIATGGNIWLEFKASKTSALAGADLKFKIVM